MEQTINNIWHFPIMIIVSIIIFFVVIRIVLDIREFKQKLPSIILLSFIVIIFGMLLGKYGANLGLKWWIFYPIPMLLTVLLPPIVLKMKNNVFRKACVILSILLAIGCSGNKPKPFSVWEEPVTGMKFVFIPKGKFLMGNSLGDDYSALSETPHKVSISQDFWLGQFEVTREQWVKIMGTEELHPEKPSPFSNDNPHFPVVSKSFYDVQQFIDKLNTISTGNCFRLPSEAEWEYACRAKTTTAFSFGGSISDSLANFNAELQSKYAVNGKYIGHPVQVGSYPANSWGIYDMHGNVWEWVSDWYAPYPVDTQINPKGPSVGTLKVIRGGSWYFSADNAQSSTRRTHEPGLWGFSIGFRIVCDKKVND